MFKHQTSLVSAVNLARTLVRSTLQREQSSFRAVRRRKPWVRSNRPTEKWVRTTTVVCSTADCASRKKRLHYHRYYYYPCCFLQCRQVMQAACRPIPTKEFAVFPNQGILHAPTKSRSTLWQKPSKGPLVSLLLLELALARRLAYPISGVRKVDK